MKPKHYLTLAKCCQRFARRHGDGLLPLKPRWKEPGKIVEVYDPWRGITDDFKVKKGKIKRVKRKSDERKKA